jgi:nucleoid-associated protein YgaU
MSGKLEKTKTGYYEANQGFATTFEGEPLFVQKGELVHKSHPLLKGREELFDPAEHISRFDVEAATAAPGEKRGRRKKAVSETEEPEAEPEAEPVADDAEGDTAEEAAPEDEGDK